MCHRTVVLSSFEELVADEGVSVDEMAERSERMVRFPFAVMLKVSFPELDFANRWCWRVFGPGDGECSQEYSRYRACTEDGPHSHNGQWTSHWWVKIDYDFGFNEWYFARSTDHDRFLASVSEINWGEDFAERTTRPD